MITVYRAETWAALALLSAGCGAATNPAYQTRDSAGIRIVDNARPSGPGLALDSAPAIDIGPAGGPGAEFISSPVSAVRLDDGRIIAAGWAMSDIRVFDSTGRWIRTVGRLGAGPREFEALGFVYRSPGDSLVTFEPGTQRLQRWTPTVEFKDLTTLISPSDRAMPWVWGVFSDGSLFLGNSRLDHAAGSAVTVPHRNALYRTAAAGAPWDTLLQFDGRVSIRHPANPNGTVGSPLFSAEPAVHQRGNQFAFAPGDRFEVQLRTLDGRLRMIARRTAEPRSISSAEFEAAIADWRTTLPPDLRRQILPRLREASTSRTRPAVAGVWLAGDGRIWATFGEPAIGETVRATVFDSLGRWEGDVSLPTGIDINQVDRDGLLGTFTDADGFRHLRFYRFRTPGR